MEKRSKESAIIPQFMAEKLSQLEPWPDQVEFARDWLGWEIDEGTFIELQFYRTKLDGLDGVYYTYEVRDDER